MSGASRLLTACLVVHLLASTSVLVLAQTDCEWDCATLDGEALQIFSEWTSPTNGSWKNEIARLDPMTGVYIGLAHYDSLDYVNALVFWRDNITNPGTTMDKLFAVESREFEGDGEDELKKNYLIQLCPNNDMYIRRAVLPDRSGGGQYYTASSSNDGTMWLSGGGTSNILNIDFASIYNQTLPSIASDDTSPYSHFSVSGAGGTAADIAWYEPCQVFVGLSRRSPYSVSDAAVMIFEYGTDPASTNISSYFFDSIDGPQVDHQSFGACYTFLEGDAVFCSGNGRDSTGADGALYRINMNPETCEPTGVNFRVVTQPGNKNDGTTCRYPGTLPCTPAYVKDSPEVSQCALSRILESNAPNDGGTGTWTQEAGDITVTFSDATSLHPNVTASAAGSATLRWTLTDAICPDDYAEIVINFGSGCCAQNQHVDGGVCTNCTGVYIREAGDDPEAGDTDCVWPVCPSHSYYTEGTCKCISGYYNDPEWTGATWTDSCRPACKICAESYD